MMISIKIQLNEIYQKLHNNLFLLALCSRPLPILIFKVQAKLIEYQNVQYSSTAFNLDPVRYALSLRTFVQSLGENPSSSSSNLDNVRSSYLKTDHNYCNLVLVR